MSRPERREAEAEAEARAARRPRRQEPETASDDRAERRAEWRAASGFLLTAAAAVGLAIVYWSGGQTQVEGVLLALAFAGLGIGFAQWGMHLLPQGPYEQARHSLAAPEDEREAFEDDLERGGVVERRTLLVRTLGLAAGTLGVAFLFPIRSLGPGPGKALLRTSWRRGRRVVTEDGTPVRASEVPLDGLVTVFPEGDTRSGDAQAVLVRVDPSLEGAGPDGFLCYSKVCTHAGCPVGLYQAGTHQLLCPCHQSAFDVLRGAAPVFGPAAWPLPRLPISIDADGYLRADGDFDAPVGPGWWKTK